jgi:hypothetical protein
MTQPFDPYKPPAAPLDAPPATAGANAIPASVVSLLAQTRPWVKLMSILVFLASGLACLGLLVAFAVAPMGMSERMVLAPVALLLGFYVPPAIFLWRYAGGIRRLESGGGLPALEEALSNQKSLWKYVGIFAVVVIGLYLLAAVGGLVIGAFNQR